MKCIIILGMSHKISVILPVYNVEPYLARCLDSIIENTYKNLEIIIVDDASPDNSANVYNGYAANDERIKTIKHEKNMGVSVARNNGLNAATGEYIHFCDPDDWVSNNFYENLLLRLIETGATMSTSQLISVNGRLDRKLEYKTTNVLIDFHEKMKIMKMPKCSWCWKYLFKKSFLIENNLTFPVGIAHGEDVIFMLGAVKVAESIAPVQDATYYYYKRPGSATCAPKSKKIKQDIKFRRQYVHKFMDENGMNYYWYRVRTLLERFVRTRY